LYKSKEGLSVMSTKGERDQMNVSDAVAMIPRDASERQEHFARDIEAGAWNRWQKRSKLR
jgi:hypothetical protein